MHNDLDVIVKKYPHEQNVLRVYAIGDVHVGSECYNDEAIRKKISIIQEDEFGVVSICGDLGDFGLKNSVSNVYRQTLNPTQQKDYLYELFRPIADKIIALVPGNHEARLTREVGICPLYDLSVRWGIEDVYRENVAITKLMFGDRHKTNRQHIFIGVTTHGTTKNKHNRFIGHIDNADFEISGHTHSSLYEPSSRIRINRLHGTAMQVPFKSLVVDANLKPGGYGLKKEYPIAPPPELQYLELSVWRDSDRNRTEHRVMDYHAITI